MNVREPALRRDNELHTPGNQERIRRIFSRSAAYPVTTDRKVRGQEHGGKAGGREKALKLQTRKTCMMW